MLFFSSCSRQMWTHLGNINRSTLSLSMQQTKWKKLTCELRKITQTRYILMSMIKPEVFTTSSFFRVCRIPTRKYGIRWNEHCVCLIDGWVFSFFRWRRFLICRYTNTCTNWARTEYDFPIVEMNLNYCTKHTDRYIFIKHWN